MKKTGILTEDNQFKLIDKKAIATKTMKEF